MDSSHANVYDFDEAKKKERKNTAGKANELQEETKHSFFGILKEAVKGLFKGDKIVDDAYELRLRTLEARTQSEDCTDEEFNERYNQMGEVSKELVNREKDKRKDALTVIGFISVCVGYAFTNADVSWTDWFKSRK